MKLSNNNLTHQQQIEEIIELRRQIQEIKNLLEWNKGYIIQYSSLYRKLYKVIYKKEWKIEKKVFS